MSNGGARLPRWESPSRTPALAASRAGHPTLRFNFRGVGASPGTPGPVRTLVEDIEAGLAALQENAGTEAAAVVSLGGSARAVLRLEETSPGLAGSALVSPGELEGELLARVQTPLLVVVGEAEPLRRDTLGAALAEAGGVLVVIPAADGRFQRNLPDVGRSVVQWLAGLAPSA